MAATSRPTSAKQATRAGTATKAAKVTKAPKAPKAPPQHTLVLLVRHGQTPTTGSTLPGRAKGLHLAEAGTAQAEAVAARIGALANVDAVYASPLERTRETAAPIARAVGQRVKVDKGLLECEFGDWTGRKLSELNRLPEWQTVQRYPSGFRFPGGESFTEMQHRMVSAVHRLGAAHRGRTVVLVSHADPIKAAVAEALGTHLDLFQRIVISPCSVTAILQTPAGPVVLAVNSTGDDLAKLVPS
jgi:probable phosphomutase (TIGR03848 family)